MSQGKAYEDIVQGEKGFGKPPEKQRVLIFQGGAALGAYEAGAYQVLYNHIRKQLEEESKGSALADLGRYSEAIEHFDKQLEEVRQSACS